MKKSKSVEDMTTGPVPAKAGKKRVGQVTPEERDEIKVLFERKNALVELFKTLADSSPMNEVIYEKLVADLGKVTTLSNQWWSAKSAKYQWNSAQDGTWEIDFADCSIYLNNSPRQTPIKHNS